MPMSTILIKPENIELIKQVDAIEGEHADRETLVAADLRARSFASIEELAATPISADCDGKFVARHSSGIRPLSQISLHIIHCTQGPTALAAASWFANPNSKGSAQYCIDNEHCFRTLRDRDVAWGAPGANYHGQHYEMAGYVTWSQAIWSKTHRRTLLRCAWKVARDCKRYGNPVKWLSVDDLKAGKKGISDHNSCSKAFGGNHTDPGPNFPRAIFMTMVRMYYASLKIRRAA